MSQLDRKRVLTGCRQNEIVGRTVDIHHTVNSTMDIARQAAGPNIPDGHTVLAEQQRSGRGRDGAWQCPPGQGLLMTVLLKGSFHPDERHLLSFLGPIAATETLRDVGVPAEIKWPNDIVICEDSTDLQFRKLGGILVEQVQREENMPMHLLGIGLNINQEAEDLPDVRPPATSVRMETGGQRVSRHGICCSLLRKLDRGYQTLRRGLTDRLVERWRALSCLTGRRVKVVRGESR
ncbi:MAG: biotin--[acetyl-CoA-carboxylase] ligase, partial [Planctomycetota bacterium]